MAAIDRPVATGEPVPDAYMNCSLPVGADVSLPEDTACSAKVCAIAALEELE